ncbi:MAG: hypothetical protein IMW89_00025 [Ktedonobacteraceae bacterium]|nr:hypothetical protein [Ktedonobacteraceae bacterium]
MSQQEFAPQEQRNMHNDSESESIPYYYSSRKTIGETKEENPATFEDDISSYGYRAQDQVGQQSQQEWWQRNRESGFYGSTHRQRRWEVPSWARPQQNRLGKHVLRWLIIIAVIVVLIKVVIPLLLIAVGLVVLVVLALLALLVIAGLVALLKLSFRFGQHSVRSQNNRSWSRWWK